jgi:hypothetical protein
MLYGGTVPPSGIIPPGPNTAISWVTQTYSQTPEPTTLTLLGTALLGLGMFLFVRGRRLMKGWRAVAAGSKLGLSRWKNPVRADFANVLLARFGWFSR